MTPKKIGIEDIMPVYSYCRSCKKADMKIRHGKCQTFSKLYVLAVVDSGIKISVTECRNYERKDL